MTIGILKLTQPPSPTLHDHPISESFMMTTIYLHTSMVGGGVNRKTHTWKKCLYDIIPFEYVG